MVGQDSACKPGASTKALGDRGFGDHRSKDDTPFTRSEIDGSQASEHRQLCDCR